MWLEQNEQEPSVVGDEIGKLTEANQYLIGYIKDFGFYSE